MLGRRKTTQEREYFERQTKTRTGDNPRDVRKVTPKIYVVPTNLPEKDPVFVDKFYTWTITRYVSNKSFLTVMNPSKNYRFAFWRNQDIFSTRTLLEDELGPNTSTNAGTTCLNFDLTWIFHTKMHSCLLFGFFLFVFQYFGKIPVFAKLKPAILLKTLVSGR